MVRPLIGARKLPWKIRVRGLLLREQEKPERAGYFRMRGRGAEDLTAEPASSSGEHLTVLSQPWVRVEARAERTLSERAGTGALSAWAPRYEVGGCHGSRTA